MQNLLKRSFSGIIYVALLIGAILFSEYAYLLLICLLGFCCVYEFSKLIESKSWAGYIFLPLLLFLMVQRQESSPVFIILLITILSSVLLIYQLLSKKEIQIKDERTKIGLMLRYVVFSLTFLALLPFYEEGFNPKLMIGFLTIIWVNDSFAFLVGKNFGKHKLFESVSPKKTIEGFVGGLIFAVVAAFVIYQYNTDIARIHWIVIAVMISVFGTLGDLIESKYKRFANLKDSGNIMPGHGGILDRLDSLMFAAPFVYLYINYIK